MAYPSPTNRDHSTGLRFPNGNTSGAHEPAASVRMNRLGWPVHVIASTLRMNERAVREQLKAAPFAEKQS